MWLSTDPTFWMPTSASTHAALIDNLYYFLYWVSIVSFVAIVAAIVWFIKKYRATDVNHKAESQNDHSNTLEIAWSIPVAVVSVICFYFGTVGYIDMKSPPDDAYEIKVNGIKWAWSFTYPNGHINGELHVPPDRPVRLLMSSDDVIHSFFVPAFRIKQDVVPGRYTQTWFQATKPGTYDIFCTEYCGTKHSEMLAKVTVHESQDEYRQWLEKASDIFKDNEGNERPMAEVGDQLVSQRGCRQCHSLDGTRGVGPSFKGSYGGERALSDGSKVAMDENYVRNSILNPASQVVAGYPPVMPTFKGKLKDREIDAIIAYLKTLK